MKRYLLIILSLLACVFSTSFAANIVSVQIEGNWLVIGTPGAVVLWTGTVWSPIEYQFTWDNYFRIRDLRWLETWHYTTIQCDWLYREWWNEVITWVFFKTTTGILLWGLENDTDINPELQQWIWLDITEPQLYFYRENGWHNWWVTNVYIDYPVITVMIPEWTTPGVYRWKITYTLYDMSFDLDWV